MERGKRRFAGFCAEEDVEHDADNRGGEHHLDIKPEFVGQFAALRLRRDDGCVADEGQVIAKESTAYDGGGH